MFRQQGGTPKTLDVIEGFCNAGTCNSQSDPSVKVYLQRHSESRDRYVPLVVILNHLSDEFIEEAKKDIDSVPMHGIKRGARYIRFAGLHSNLKNDEKDMNHSRDESDDDEIMSSEHMTRERRFVLTFGNSADSQRFYEAHDMSAHEEKVATISNTVLYYIDVAIRKALRGLANALATRDTATATHALPCSLPLQPPQASAASSLVTPSHLPQKPQQSSPAKGTKVFSFPIGSKYGNLLDPTDAVVTQVSKGGTYFGHSDVDNKKCNNDSSNESTHPEQVRILTNCIMPEQCENDMVTMKHHLPNDPESPFPVPGFFHNGAFMQSNQSAKQGIPVGGRSSAHVQLSGSQPNIHHTPESKGKHVRFVQSCRSMGRFQRNLKDIDAITGPSPNIISVESEQSTNVYELLGGDFPFAQPMDSPTNHGANGSRSHANAQTARKRPPAPVTKLPSVSRGNHKNGDIKDYESSFREHTSGLDSVSTYDIATSGAVAKTLYENDCTMLLDADNVRQEICGPYIAKKDGVTRLLAPGERVRRPDLDATTFTNISKTNSSIMGEIPDTITIRRASKNGPEVAKILKGVKKLEGGGQMEPLVIRGHGGAGTFAGTYAVNISYKKNDKDASTHCIATSQKVSNKTHHRYLRMVENNRLVNVFIQTAENTEICVYCGPYIVSRIEIFAKSEEEVQAEKKQYEETMGVKLTPQLEGEMDVMHNTTLYVYLDPLDKDFTRHFQSGEDKIWQCMRVNLKTDIVKPTWTSIKPLTGPWQGFLRRKGFPFFSEEFKRKHGLDYVDESLVVTEGQEKVPISIDELMNGWFFASMLHTARLVGGCVEGRFIRPPSFIFDNLIESGTFSDYQHAYKETHLASVAGRAVHPTIVSQDIVAIMAMYATDSYQDHLGDCIQGVYTHRNGPDYVTSDPQAWDIIFTCIICCMMYPSALLDIQRYCTFGPGFSAEQLDDFIEAINKFSWEGGTGFIHDLFLKKFTKERESFFRFLGHLKAKGKDIFKEAVSKKSREESLSHLKSELLSQCELQCSDFQIQVIARTIELCIHEPFGPVTTVASGFGGTSAMTHFLQEYKNEHPKSTAGMTKENILKLIPAWLVEKINNRTKGIMEGCNESSKQQLKHELAVLDVRWSSEQNCIIHTTGIKKKLDASDMEHIGCTLYRLVKNTMSCNNRAENVQLDDPRFAPIKVPENTVPAHDSDILHHQKQNYNANMLPSFCHLLANKKYRHSAVDQRFRIGLQKKKHVPAKGPSHQARMQTVSFSSRGRIMKYPDIIYHIPNFTDLPLSSDTLLEKLEEAAPIFSTPTISSQICNNNTSAICLCPPTIERRRSNLFIVSKGFLEVYVGSFLGVDAVNNDESVEDGVGALWKGDEDNWSPVDKNRYWLDLVKQNIHSGIFLKFVLSVGDALLIPCGHIRAMVTHPGTSYLSVLAQVKKEEKQVIENISLDTAQVKQNRKKGQVENRKKNTREKKRKHQGVVSSIGVRKSARLSQRKDG